MFSLLLGVCCLILLPDGAANISEAPWSCLALCSAILITTVCSAWLKPGWLDLLVADDLALQL